MNKGKRVAAAAGVRQGGRRPGGRHVPGERCLEPCGARDLAQRLARSFSRLGPCYSCAQCKQAKTRLGCRKQHLFEGMRCPPGSPLAALQRLQRRTVKQANIKSTKKKAKKRARNAACGVA